MSQIDDARIFQFSERHEFKRECESLFEIGKTKFHQLSGFDVRELIDVAILALSQEHCRDIAEDSVTISNLGATLYSAANHDEMADIATQMKDVFRAEIQKQYIEEIKQAFEYCLVGYQLDAEQSALEGDDDSKRQLLRINHIYKKDVLLKHPFKLIQGVMPV
jgi:hypothetical protein